MAGVVGRPRKNSPRRRGSTAREEILDASSELFTTQGFANTSTHQIAEAVGIRQASLYYHFPSKTEIFLTLLKSTIEPSLELADELSSSKSSPQLRLWALVAAEARLLLTSGWNVGRLYQLPVANSPDFDDFHQQRAQLQQIFHDTTVEIIGEDDQRTDLPFHIALSAMEMRENNGTPPFQHSDTELPSTAIMLADAALRVLQADFPDDREQATLDMIAAKEAKKE
ncbi:TetR/AcrR family transcriptional regulator [Corynebacteriaceae bacterium 6-324]